MVHTLLRRGKRPVVKARFEDAEPGKLWSHGIEDGWKQVTRPYELPPGGISEEGERRLLERAGFSLMHKYGDDVSTFALELFRGEDQSPAMASPSIFDTSPAPDQPQTERTMPLCRRPDPERGN
jgi:hypothetical protein